MGNIPYSEQLHRLGKEYTDEQVLEAVPLQAEQDNKYLKTNGEHTSWADVDHIPEQSGQAGKYLTTNGETISWQRVSEIPVQTGNAGKFLTTNGTIANWATIKTGSAFFTRQDWQQTSVIQEGGSLTIPLYEPDDVFLLFWNNQLLNDGIEFTRLAAGGTKVTLNFTSPANTRWTYITVADIEELNPKTQNWRVTEPIPSGTKITVPSFNPRLSNTMFFVDGALLIKDVQYSVDSSVTLTSEITLLYNVPADSLWTAFTIDVENKFITEEELDEITGLLVNLNTENKSNLVSAINEVLDKAVESAGALHITGNETASGIKTFTSGIKTNSISNSYGSINFQNNLAKFGLSNSFITLDTINGLQYSDGNLTNKILSTGSGGVISKPFFKEIKYPSNGALDLSSGSVFNITLTEDTVFSFNNCISNTFFEFYLNISMGDNFTVTWPNTVFWSAIDGIPILSSQDILVFMTFNGGSTWQGKVLIPNATRR